MPKYCSNVKLCKPFELVPPCGPCPPGPSPCAGNGYYPDPNCPGQCPPVPGQPFPGPFPFPPYGGQCPPFPCPPFPFPGGQCPPFPFPGPCPPGNCAGPFPFPWNGGHSGCRCDKKKKPCDHSESDRSGSDRSDSGCGCDNKKRCDHSDSDRSESESDCGCDKKKKKKCCKPLFVFCHKTKCGLIALSLTKTANVSVLPPTGGSIVYTYMVTNMGTDFLCGPIQIADNRTGNKQITGPALAPGASITTTMSYTVTAADTTAGSVSNCATANIQLSKRQWLTSTPASVTINA